MSGFIPCPVCGFTHVPEERESCPQCDADLVCFRLLGTLSPRSSDPVLNPENDEPALPESPEKTEMPADPHEQAGHQNENTGNGQAGNRKIGNYTLGVLALCVFLISGYTAIRIPDLSDSIHALDARLTQLTSGIELYNGEIDQIRQFSHDIQNNSDRINRHIQKIQTHVQTIDNHIENVGLHVETIRSHHEKIEKRIEKTGKTITKKIKKPLAEKQTRIPAVSFRTGDLPCLKEYHAADTDTLWGIAQDLLGDGVYYPVLLACNPDLNIFKISSRNTLKYPCEKARVPGIYQQVTASKHNRRYLKYTIKPGDTPQSVANRYCSNKTNCFVDGFSFKSGGIIGVFLE